MTKLLNTYEQADFERLRERVRITRSSQGTPQAEHLPEPKPRLPSSEGDWSHVFQDVTWGESDG